MVENREKLSFELRRALGQEDEPTADASAPSYQNVEFFSRYEALKDIPVGIIRKAWFTTAHLLLPPGAKVVDMGSNNGQMAYAMAVLNPQLEFIGIDIDRKLVASAKQKYRLPNLEYRVGDASKGDVFDPGSLDAIVNSYIMHEIYSGSKYHDRSVLNALEEQFKLLKQDGLMFMRAYPMPPPGDMVLLEMPDLKGGADVLTMSEPDLLVWYAERARPKQDPGCHGFFLEELPPRFPDTRLFRLSYKWAYEFITRKDDRGTFEAALHKEYAFFTKRDFRKALRALGARVLYSSPHWDESEIKTKFEGHFRLYKDDGTPLGIPPTSFVAVAQKVGESRSLKLLERRPSNQRTGRLQITAMRNERDGRIVDIVSRDFNCTQIIPYRIDADGELSVFLHDGAPRGIINAVQRNGRNIDEKYWSGHMVEAISVDSDIVAGFDNDDIKAVVHFARDHLGLRPAIGATLEKGPGLYPAPDFIEDHVGTRYLRLESGGEPMEPKNLTHDMEGFTTRGRIREIGAQAVLNAIAVGMIPSAQLEVQIIALFEKLKIQVETWDECPLTLEQEDPAPLFDAPAFAKMLTEDDGRYKSVRGTAGQLRNVQSIFVDEGWVDGGLSGLSARDMEFIISDEQTSNKAVVMPLTRNASGTVMAGITTEYLPVPQRYQGNGLTIRSPSFDLPKEITTMYEARKFIAAKFDVPVENVYKMGESFFLHTGVTPQRVFPFAVAAHKGAPKMLGGMTQFFPLKKLYAVMFRVMDWNMDVCTCYQIMKSYRFLADTSDQHLKIDFGRQMMYKMFEAGGEKFENMTGLSSPRSAVPAAAAKPAQGAQAEGFAPPPSGAASSGKSKSGKSGDGKSDGGDSGGGASATGGEPAFSNANENYVAPQRSQSAVSARGKSGGGGGGMGGGAKIRIRSLMAEGDKPKDDANQQQQPQPLQKNDNDAVIVYRSEPAFDSSGEEFVATSSGKDRDDAPAKDKHTKVKSGT